MLAQVLDALIEYQSRMHPEHLDPLHITAHYLYRNLTGPFEVHVKPVKHGRTFTNLTADFVQEVGLGFGCVPHRAKPNPRAKST